MIAVWSDPVRGGVAGALSAFFHLSLFMVALQLAGPARHVSIPVEIEIVTRSPHKETPKPSRPEPSPVRVMPPKPVTQPRPVPPAMTIPEAVPEPDSPGEGAIGPALPVTPGVAEAPRPREPVYTPLVQVTRMPTFKIMVEPVYPALAKRLERDGTVIVEVNISEKGEVLKVEVVQGAGSGFDEAAKKAIERSSFEPARVGERTVAVVVRIPIRFRIKD